ncbi:MAG: MscL family protein [bacterium]|nr:MscL family protein [bacterium]
MAKNEPVRPTTGQIAKDLVTKAKEELLEQEEKRLKKQAKGFMEFVREQGVVGLAVGLAIGTAATVFVKSIVDNMIIPIIGAVLPGGTDLAGKFVCLTSRDGACINKLAWGAVVSNFITFLAVAAVIYFVVKGFKLDKLDKKKET